jgi:hypothetical protein
MAFRVFFEILKSLELLATEITAKENGAVFVGVIVKIIGGGKLFIADIAVIDRFYRLLSLG